MKAMVGLVIAILIIFTVTLFWPTAPNETHTSIEETEAIKETVATDIAQEKTKTDTQNELNAPADDEKSELMAAEYKLLEKARNDLKRQLARLKHEMWGLKFPAEEAKEMNEIMLNAHKLIKNPHMLGAFSSVEGIRDEIDKIIFANKALDDVKAMIEKNKNSKAAIGQ